jgi:hypothetical protein
LAVDPGEESFHVGSFSGDYGLVVSDLSFSDQLQETILWMVALGLAWPVWIDGPDPAERQRADTCGFVPTIYR